tara:strand:- start:117 stop:398 length:282 start_codon:yes stop_codon:yes gene_type:complete
MNKIKEEQLKTIQEQQTKIHQLLNEIGVREAQKMDLLNQLARENEEVNEFKKQLEDEYGQVNINVETGEYEEIEKDEENKLKVVKEVEEPTDA